MHADSFVNQLRVMAALEDSAATDRVLEAFRNVPREAFAGSGPWKLRSPHEGFSLPILETPDADPKWLYNSVLIVLDEEKGINIGDPVFWARRFMRANVQPGVRILQVGAGVGYYTAVLSHLAGPKGCVVAFEVEQDLAERARENLADWPNAEVRHGNAATDLKGEEKFDLIVAFAGITHVPDLWTSHLSPGAELLVPLTGNNWWGAMVLAQRQNQGFDAVTLGRVGVYPCVGARDDKLARRISELFGDQSRVTDCRLRLDTTNGTTRIELAA
ncbi:MAG: methyltransferase domain-containing protein [Pseudomonadota bacterium]